MSVKELSAASKYEAQLQNAFREAQLKQVIPVKQEEAISITGETQLQENITRRNLNSMLPNQSGLVNAILEYIKSEDDMIQFNKYINQFKAAVSGIKIKSVDDFKKLYNQFKDQQLGKQLLQQEIAIRLPSENIADLNKMTTSDLNALFVQVLEQTTGKKLPEINEIRYYKYDGKLSVPYELINKNSKNVEFRRGTTKVAKTADSNNIKIRYIFANNNPDISMKGNMGIKWTGPITGSGLLSKKKLMSDHIRSR